MSEQVESGATTTEGGANGQTVTQQTTEVSSTQAPQEAALKRALDDMHKFKRQTQELQQQIQSLQDEKLKSQNDFKSLYERTKGELEETRKQKEQFISSYFEDQKRGALKSAVLKLGLRPEAESDLDLIDLSDVAIERTDQGRVLVHGADSKAEQIKKTRPHWFKNQTQVTINSGGTNSPAVETGNLTPQFMVELERKDPKKYRELFPKFIEQRKLRGTK